jgi:hypothetical protein
MLAFSATGQQFWSQPNYTPQIATSDGGMIATSSSGQTVTIGQNGNPTGQLASFPRMSWTGNFYPSSLAEQVTAAAIHPAISFEAEQGGNPSTLGTSVTTVSFQKHIAIDTANPPHYTDVPLHGIATSQTESVLVTLGAGTKPVTLTIASTAQGSATFEDGSTTTTVPVGTATQVVKIKGVRASQTADDLTLTASTDQKTTLGSAKFSVVSVTIDWKTSNNDTISDDNRAKSDYFNEYKPSPNMGSPQYTGLGAFATDSHFGCHTGVQFTGTIAPSNYKGTVVLRRTLVEGKYYKEDQIFTLPDDSHPPNDTSNADTRDDDPQSDNSKGVVYDLDAPGINEMTSPESRYLRQNFVEYAVLDSAQNDVHASDPFPWFSRVACGMDENNPAIVFLLNNPGDNIVGKGSTSLSK